MAANKFRLSLVLSTAMLCSLPSAIAVLHAAEPSGFARFAEVAPAAAPGQSVTLLSDGRWLFVGGEQAGVPGGKISARQVLRTVEQQKAPSFTARLAHPRSSHTATVLPDGTVLILGGVGVNGVTVAAAEILDPVSGEVTVVGDSGLSPRSHHAATLLTDGYVLITGGIAPDGKALQEAELWNPETQRAEPLSNTMLVPRADHSATLLSDGKGLIWGGQDASGQQLASGEVYDPTQTRFNVVNPSDPAALPPAYLRDAPPAMEASIPQANATDASVSGRIAIRFSKFLQVRSVTPQSVTLVGPAGAVTGKVVAAGDGLLVFFTAHTDLLPDATYTVFLRDLSDAQGQTLPWSAFRFTTKGLAATPINSGATSTGSVNLTAPAVTAPVNALAVRRTDANDQEKSKDKKSTNEDEKQKPAADDEFEDWIPGEHHRRGQWRVLGTRNEPRTSKALLRGAPLRATARIATAVSGRVAKLNGLPIQGVLVKAGSVSTLTDAQGRFVLAGLRAGVQEITVDGSGVTSEGRRYASHFIRVEVAAKRTTVMEQPIHLARLNPANDVAIPSPADKDLVITHPDMPGLELHIPKGSVLRSRDGRVLTMLNITPLPVDRVPFALPDGFPVYFTIQPAGAFVDNSATGTATGVRVIYPNYLDAPAGTRVAFWNYDPAGLGWQVYGRGTVSENGRQVIPDVDVLQRNFMAFGYGFDNFESPSLGPAPGGDCKKGDPVDCATGIFLHQVTDLYVADTISLAMTRTYRPNDTRSRDFGIGTNHGYGLFLSNPTGNSFGMPHGVDLVLPDGGKVRFALMSGTEIGNAVYQHLNSPTPWLSATLRINAPADQWEITTRDKTIYSFTGHTPNVLTGIRDRYGNTVKILRATEGGKITQVISPNGRTLNFEYDAGNRITRIRDNLGRVVKYEYDAQGRLWKATDPDNKVERYEYDAAHRMKAVIDKRGNTMVTNVYDGNGRVSQQTLADGAIWGFSYTLNSLGKVATTTVTNPRGYVSQMTFNAGGYVTEIIDALGQPEQQTYTLAREAGSNQRTSVTDPLGRVTRFQFDHLGNITNVTRLFGTPDAITVALTYEPVFGNLTSYTDPLNHETRLDYDAAGNLVSVTDPLNHTVGAAYDLAGKMTAVTTALSKTTQLEYEQGDLYSITDPLNRTSTVFTDAVGRTIGVRDPAGNRTRYELDPLDRVMRSIDPRGAATVMTYDEIGNMLSVRDARDLSAHVFTYDELNRVETYTDPLGETEAYDYDLAGNLVSTTDRKGQLTSYTYDALDRLRTITYADSSTITVVWDAGNRPRQFIDSINGTITHDYDDLDRLTRELSPQGQLDYEYDDAGRRIQLTVSGHSPVNYEYDDSDRLTHVEQNGVTVETTYDASNRRATATLPNGTIATYWFDDADQLLSIAYRRGDITVGEVTHTHDLAGRRIGQSGSLAELHMPATVSTAQYDNGNRLIEWGLNRLTYDDNGNLTSLGSATYSWSARNELTSTSDGASSFSYDVLGRRITRTVNGNVDSYLHDGLSPVTIDEDFLLSGLGLDEIYALVSSSGVTSFLSDALGSTRLLLDANGSSTAIYSYEPYGGTSISGSNATSFQFTGRENDGASNLYYYRSRYYSPKLNRFVSEDPIGLSAGMNMYAYVEGDPVSLADPTGECPWCIGAAIGFGFDLVTQLARNGGDWRCIDVDQLATSTALGALGGGLGGNGLSNVVRGLSNKAKGRVGETLSLIENRLAGSRLINKQARIPGQRTIADSIWSSWRGATYYVESKFGRSSLSSAQRAAQRALGDVYHVERWGYPFFQRAGAYPGGVAGAIAGDALDGGCGCQ